MKVRVKVIAWVRLKARAKVMVRLAYCDDPESCAGKGPTKPQWSTVIRQTRISSWSSKFGVVRSANDPTTENNASYRNLHKQPKN